MLFIVSLKLWKFSITLLGVSKRATQKVHPLESHTFFKCSTNMPTLPSLSYGAWHPTIHPKDNWPLPGFPLVNTAQITSNSICSP